MAAFEINNCLCLQPETEAETEKTDRKLVVEKPEINTLIVPPNRF